MIIKHKVTNATAEADHFNLRSITEPDEEVIVVHPDDEDLDTFADEVINYDVFINDTWHDMKEAFDTNLISHQPFSFEFTITPLNEDGTLMNEEQRLHDEAAKHGMIIVKLGEEHEHDDHCDH